ncbi:MAG: hypothetical protein ETSY1_24945 [Candidatus Entotheonella factor]|uniref:Uncharacterized protein n=1 Tax=Entotheonella factor TaxID=1429438 RepID=W4LGN4_ENTF1|nr:MAG: hypothetical protein ETSY1_24945 [Candidatus Entotheonella factor]
MYGSDHHAVALLPRAKDVLVADLKKIAILQFDLSGKFLGEFGDGVLQLQRDTYRQQKRRTGLILAGGAAVFAVVTGILIWFFIQRARQQTRWLLQQVPALQT